MVIQRGGTILKDRYKVVTALKASHEIAYEGDRMLGNLTDMIMRRGSTSRARRFPRDFNTISVMTAAPRRMCKRAVDFVSGMGTSGVATHMHATQVIAKTTYPPDHANEYEGLTLAPVKDMAKIFVIRFAFIMGKRSA